jgi:hypothetical protein
MSNLHRSDSSRKPLVFTLFPDGPTFRFSPALARLVGGANEALLLLQLDYWLHNLRDVVVFEGEPWIELSSRRVYDFGFNHMSTRGISKLISRLEGLEVIRVGFLAGQPGRWVTIDYEGLEGLGVSSDLSAWERRAERSSQADGRSGTEFPRTGNGVRNGVPGFSSQIGSDKVKESEQQPPASQPGEGEESTLIPLSEKLLKEAWMINALVTATGADPVWKFDHLESVAMALVVSYEPGDVDRHAEWWSDQDWRGQKGDRARPGEIAQTIRQSVEWHERWDHIPVRAHRRELLRLARPDCPECGGRGWIEDLADPRSRWVLCACVPDRTLSERNP